MTARIVDGPQVLPKMKPKQVLALLLLYMAALSAMASYMDIRRIHEPQWSVMLTTIAASMLIFWWYWADSTSRSYRRSPLLNVAIIAVGVLAVPYYLVRSREKGQRLLALAKLLGFAVLIVVAVAIGGLPFAMIG